MSLIPCNCTTTTAEVTVIGIPGLPGVVGIQGPQGAQGPVGPAGASAGALAFGEFYALMPGDNAATVAVGAAMEFPQDGATSASGITRLTASTFNLSTVGTYHVDFSASISEAGQLAIAIGGVVVAKSVVGRATGTSQIVGGCMITTSAPNSVLSIVNPAGNSTALTVTPIAGGASAVSANLRIIRIA